MNAYQNAKNKYILDHMSKRLKEPQKRIKALAAIENIITNSRPDLLEGEKLFSGKDIEKFKELYQYFKGENLSSAEESVINGLYKFATMGD